MERKFKIIGALAVSFASVLWGFDGIVLTPRLYNLDVIFVVFILHLIPFIIMNLFLFREYKHLKQFSTGDAFMFFLVALFGGVIGTAAIVKALFLVNFQELSIVVLLQKLQPVFSIALAALILKERLKRRFITWAVLALGASYFLVFGFNLPDIHAEEKTVYAALFALLAAFSFGSSTVFSKKVLLKYSFQAGTFFRYGFSTVILFIVVIVGGKIAQFNEVTTVNWMYFLIIAFTTGSGAIFLYYYGLTRIRAMLATMCELFFPISAIFFDFVFNGKILNAVQWVAAIIMIFAIIKLSQPVKAKNE
ncbi:MAG: DMT family transporter [Bacteroidales bacterium]|nr:DMT family transporter [Bacteroidales bacterium]